MNITGGRDYVKFNFENGYTVKAMGEMLTGGRFVVYKNTMKAWEPPHEKEQLSAYDIEQIIIEVQNKTNENTVKLIFE